MGISAKEAAELVGISKDGILKAIRTGKISAQKDINGTWKIEPVELFRVYDAAGTSDHAHIDATLQTTLQSSTEASTDSLQSENRVLREMIQRQDDVITDLRARLDAEAEERRRLSMRLEVESEERLKLTLRLPEVQNAAPPSPAPQAEQPKGFWRRVFGH